MKLNQVTEDVLKVIDSYGFKQEGAYNLRLNGMAVCHGDSRHIAIVKKTDLPGIDIKISGEAQNEQVHIPVVMSEPGLDVVYNDFYVEDGADVTIVAGCGIHGEGCSETRHDGIHTFHVGKNANVKYVENHYAGRQTAPAAKILNPVTRFMWVKILFSPWRPPRSKGLTPPSVKPSLNSDQMPNFMSQRN